MHWMVVAAALTLSVLIPKTAFAQSATLAPGVCFTRVPTDKNKSTKLYIDGASRDLGEVGAIKIINAGAVTIIEAYFSQGSSAYTETFVSQGHRLDMFLSLFNPAEACPAPSAHTN